MRQIQCTCTEFWCVQCPRPAGPSALDKHLIQGKCFELSYSPSESKCKFINLIHTRQKNKIICLISWKVMNELTLKCHSTWRVWAYLPSEKYGSVDLTFTCASMHQKHHAQSRRSTRSTLDIFNTLRVFAHKPSENNELSRSVWIEGSYTFVCEPDYQKIASSLVLYYDILKYLTCLALSCLLSELGS